MAEFQPVTLEVSGIDLCVFLPGLEQPILDRAKVDELAARWLSQFPAEVADHLQVPKDRVTFYEPGDEYLRFMVKDMSVTRQVAGPWEVRFCLQPLVDQMQLTVDGLAASGVQVKMLVHVPLRQHQLVPGWFVSAIEQFAPMVNFDHLIELEGAAIAPAR